MSLWFYVIRIIPVTEATAISYLTPLLNIIAALIIFREKISLARILAIIFGFLGALLIIHPVFIGDVEGYGLAILTVSIWVIGDLLTKAQTGKDKTIIQCFYIILFTLIFLLPFIVYYGQIPNIQEVKWFSIMGMAQFANLFALFRAYKVADLAVIMPFDFCRLLFTLCGAYYLYNETICNTSLVGVTIILASNIYLLRKASYEN